MDPTDRDTRSHQDHDPFVSFRSFVDAQFDRFASGVHAIPDVMPNLRSWLVHPHGESDQPRIWSHGPTGSSLSSADINPEARQAVNLLLAQAQKANANIDRHRIARLYNDYPFSGDFPWLGVAWFESSPYSPAQIERHAHTHQHGSMWRAAFEDLLSAELGKRLNAHPAWSNQRHNQALYSAWAQAPRDWMLGLSCRGILPPHLPRLYLHGFPAQDNILKELVTSSKPRVPKPVFMDYSDLASAVSTFDADEIDEQKRPETEQDLYEAFLGGQASQCPVAQYREAKEAQVSKPSILSTLTTTERTTLPDGTVTTKVVLKKRFADGREESSETVSTTQGHLQIPQRNKPDVEVAAQSKGWFWS